MFEVKRSFYSPLQDRGVWSPSTATSNFCEEDYQTSYYIAEFINTISNLAYIYYALYTPTIPINSITHKPSDPKHRITTSKPTWDLHTPALMAVGITSGIFHMSMHSLPQWFDESSMYILAASFIHSLLTTTYIRGDPPNPRTKAELANGKPPPNTSATTVIIRQNHVQIAIMLAIILSATSYISYATGNLTIHSVTFGLLLILSGLKLISLIFTFETPAQIRQATRTKFLGLKMVTPTQRIMLKSLLKAWLFLNLAFGLWLVDCNPGWCAWLRYVRNEVLSGMGLGVVGYVTELHGWWHIFTARAAAEYIGLVRVLTTAG